MKTFFILRWLGILTLTFFFTDTFAQRLKGENNTNQGKRVWRKGSLFLGAQNANSNNPRLFVTNGHVLFDNSVMDNAPGTGTGAWPAVPTTGASNRFMFMPNFAAMRVGQVTGTQWNNTSGNNLIGLYTFAGGLNSNATDIYGFAYGNLAQSNGRGAFALGENVTAGAANSFAIGRNVGTANFVGSLIFGDQSNTVTALNASAANQFSARYTGGYRFFTDPNGVSTQGIFFSNAGNVGLGVPTPNEKLEVAGRILLQANTATGIATNGTIRWNGTDFEGRKGGVWVRLDDNGGGGTADNLGNHIATLPLQLGNNWLTDNASFNRGLNINSTGQVLITNGTTFTSATAGLHSDGSVRFSGLPASTAQLLAIVADANGNLSTRSLNPEAFTGSGLANNLSLTNTVARWDNTNGTFEHGTLSDDGTTVSNTGNVALDANGNTISVANLPTDPGDDELTLMLIEGGTNRVVTRELSNIEDDPQIANNLQNGEIPHWNGVELASGNLHEVNSLIGIGTNTPNALLHINGGAVLADGNTGGTPTKAAGASTRMVWVPAKAAFRAGQIDNAGATTEWNDANIGNNSAAFNLNTTASGSNSFAVGNGTTASGTNAMAAGNGASAGGNDAAAFGTGTQANNNSDFATGSGGIANGGSSMVTGSGNNANGNSSVANGTLTSAMNTNSTSNGIQTFAFGTNSYAAGQSTYAGPLAAPPPAIGVPFPPAFPSPLGSPNILLPNLLPPNSPRGIAPFLIGQQPPTPRTDQFSAGQGTVASGQAAAVFNYFNHATGDFAFACNEVNLASNTASFASGHYTISLAFASASFNDSTNATAQAASSFGTATTASGVSSLATGNNTAASGLNASSFGQRSSASGQNAIAMGQNTTASGLNSFAMGQNTTAGASNSVAIGQGTSPLTPLSNTIPSSLIVDFQGSSTTPTFFVGPVVGATPPVPEGVGIRTNAPTQALHVNGNAVKSVGGTAWLTTSDARLKDEKSTIENGLDLIMQMRPVTYTYNQLRNEKFGADPGLKYGFMAQELKEIVPEFVEVDAEGTHWYNPSGFEAIFTSALQQQQAQFEAIELEKVELQENLNALSADLEVEKAANAALESQLSALEAQVVDQQVTMAGELADLRLMVADICNNGCEGQNEPLNAPSKNGTSQLKDPSELFQNMPNPFREKTVIRYNLAGKVDQASITIYNLSGTSMASYSLPLVKGRGSLELNANELASGQYLYTLVVNGSEVATKKMVLTD